MGSPMLVHPWHPPLAGSTHRFFQWVYKKGTARVFALVLFLKLDYFFLSYGCIFIQVAMLEYRQKRLEMEPVKWTKVSSSSEKLDSLEFRKILCKGVFDEKKSIYVGPRSRSISGVTENGYYLITPLMPVPDDPER